MVAIRVHLSPVLGQWRYSIQEIVLSIRYHSTLFTVASSKLLALITLLTVRLRTHVRERCKASINSFAAISRLGRLSSQKFNAKHSPSAGTLRNIFISLLSSVCSSQKVLPSYSNRSMQCMEHSLFFFGPIDRARLLNLQCNLRIPLSAERHGCSRISLHYLEAMTIWDLWTESSLA